MEILKGWEPFSFDNGSKTGILLIHGFTGSTSSVVYLGRRLSEAGFNVEGPRLSGHGTRWEDLNNVSCKDWLRDVESSYSNLRKNSKIIFAAGLSMGGMLSLRMAELHPEIRGVITINHFLFVDSPLAPFTPVIKLFLKSVPGQTGDIKDPAEKEISYGRTPVAGVHEVRKLQKIVRKDIGRIVVPALMFKSKNDHVVKIRSTVWAYENISSKDKELVWLENSYHVATQDFDKDIIAEKSIEFIKKHSF